MVGYPATDAEPPPVDRLKYFGIWLREEREAAGMSQRALARQAGLSPQAVSRIERGETQTPRWETIRRLATALGIAPERLIQWSWRPLAADAAKTHWSATRNAHRYLREQLLRGVSRSSR